MSGRCECCDARLSKRESSTRFVTAPDEPRRYTNMCSRCLQFVGVPVIIPNIQEDDDVGEYTEYQVDVTEDMYDEEE